MYDRRSRFNPHPSNPLPPYPTASGTIFPPLDDSISGKPFEGSFSRPRRLSTKALESLALHVANQFAEQARERASTWLTEAQMMRQLKRTAWKVQTREERLVQDLNVVRAAIKDMAKAVDDEAPGAVLDEDNEIISSQRKWLGIFKRGTSKATPIPPLAMDVDEEIKTAAKTFLLAWQAFVDQQFGLACDAVLTCRDPIDLYDAYDVLSRIISIRATGVDKLWYEDLPVLGERAGFGGLKALNPKAKAVVWAVAEVYQVFKAEKRARKQGGTPGLPLCADSWIKMAVQTGEFLKESVMFGEEEGKKAEFEVDPEVLSLCESFNGMSIEEDDDYFSSRARSRSLRGKIDKLWEEATSYVKDELCLSS